MTKIKKPKQSEKAIQKFILEYLQTNRIGYFWRNNTGAMKTKASFVKFGLVGSADILGLLCGRFVAIECKEQGCTKLDPAQEKFKAEIDRNGGYYYLANDVDEFVNWIRALRGILTN